METVVKDRTEEKLALAQELGLTGPSTFFSAIVQARELSAMKFKPTTRAKVEKALSKWFWATPKDQDQRRLERGLFRRFVFIVPVAVAVCTSATLPLAHLWGIVAIATFALAAIVSGALGFERAHTGICSLDRWGHNLPYGALLAVKEAKAAGIGEFNIFFPTKQINSFSVEPLGTDPIIVGLKNGVLVEVFAWDDGVIYE